MASEHIAKIPQRWKWSFAALHFHCSPQQVLLLQNDLQQPAFLQLAYKFGMWAQDN